MANIYNEYKNKTGNQMDLPVTKRAQRKAATRAAVLRAAREEFNAQGYDRAKIVDIARTAEVSPGTVLNAAPTKIALLCEVMADDFRQLGEETALLAACQDGDLGVCIKALLDLHLARHMQDLELFRAAIGHNWLTNETDFKALHMSFEIAWSPVRDILTRTANAPGASLPDCPDLLTECLLDLYLGVIRRVVIHDWTLELARQQLHRRLDLIFQNLPKGGSLQ